MRGAVALMLSLIVAGGLGFVFWGLAEHRASAAAIGSVSAEVSASTFLATVGGLNLGCIFARYIPEAGGDARRLILFGYVAALVAGSLFSVIFLVTPLSSGIVPRGEAGRFGFIACVLLCSIFMIQDGGLLGFGKSAWVPIENIIVSLARLALMPTAISLVAGPIGILWAWALPLLAAVIVINVLNVGPLAGRQSGQRSHLPKYREISRFIVAGSGMSAVSSAMSAFVPVLVTRRLGATAGGYFYIPWTLPVLASSLLNVIFMSMVREVVARPAGASASIRRSLLVVVVVVAVGLLACLLGPRLLLSPLGSAFATHGAQLLRWVGFALPASAVILFYSATCLVRRQPWPVLALNLATIAGTIAGVMSIKRGVGISSVGEIYCAVQWIVAAAVSLPAGRALRVLLEGSRQD